MDHPLVEAHHKLALPSRPGTYALTLKLEQTISLVVGRLGRFSFSPGLYVYVGSARGPGGLKARITRHLRCPKPLHWHMDYMRPYVRPLRVWWVEGEQRRECVWATTFGSKLPGAVRPALGFGSSDCRCATHLLFFSMGPDRAGFESLVGERVMEMSWNG